MSAYTNNSACDRVLDCDHLPDACTNDIREEKLMQRQLKHDGRSRLRRMLERDRNLIIACIVLVIAMNFEEGRYLLYPFRLFSTWVHEMCHGMAALLMGGQIAKLQIFKDGSGLAYTATSGAHRQAFVSAGGYPGTAVTGCILLLFRRTTLGPTVGTIALGVGILLSCALWVRNTFGLIALGLEGAAFVLLGWKLPAAWLDNLFNFLAATCSLNAVDSIQDLFASSEYYVGGEVVTSSDAHSVAETWGMTYQFWATLWFWFSILMTAIGIIFAFDAKENPWFKSNGNSTTNSTTQNSNYSSYYTGGGGSRYTVENSVSSSANTDTAQYYNQLESGGGATASQRTEDLPVAYAVPM